MLARRKAFKQLIAERGSLGDIYAGQVRIGETAMRDGDHRDLLADRVEREGNHDRTINQGRRTTIGSLMCLHGTDPRHRERRCHASPAPLPGDTEHPR